MKPKAAGASAASAAEAKKAPPVFELAQGDVGTVEARELRITLPVSGSLQPVAQTTVKSKVPGQVQATLVQEGISVSSGQALARLDSADLRARVASQQAALDEAQARLALASKNSSNNQALLKQNYISQSAYDTTQNNVAITEAGVKAAAAQLQIARTALADATIHAPISGIVSRRYAQVGDKLSPDMPVFSIVNLEQLTLEAAVPASEIPRVKVGQEVTFNVDGFNGRPFSGTVTRINPTAEPGSRSMLTYITVNNADGALKGGMFAKGSIALDKAPAAPLLPLAALRGEGGTSTVYRIEGDKIVEQKVTLGKRNEDEGVAQVIGLPVGSKFLAGRLDGVKPGSKVKLALSASASAALPPSTNVKN